MNKLEFFLFTLKHEVYECFTYRCQNYLINNKLNDDDYDCDCDCDQIILLWGGRVCLDFITFPIRLIKYLIKRQLINKNKL